MYTRGPCGEGQEKTSESTEHKTEKWSGLLVEGKNVMGSNSWEPEFLRSTPSSKPNS